MPADADPAAPPPYPIGSVDNALRLLAMLRTRSAITVSEAAAELGVARSTAHRLLGMLRHHGFVRQDPDSRAYLPGRALLEIGLSVVERLDVRVAARPVLEALSQRAARDRPTSRCSTAATACSPTPSSRRPRSA